MKAAYGDVLHGEFGVLGGAKIATFFNNCTYADLLDFYGVRNDRSVFVFFKSHTSITV